jgi:hypothetical protein
MWSTNAPIASAPVEKKWSQIVTANRSTPASSIEDWLDQHPIPEDKLSAKIAEILRGGGLYQDLGIFEIPIEDAQLAALNEDSLVEVEDEAEDALREWALVARGEFADVYPGLELLNKSLPDSLNWNQMLAYLQIREQISFLKLQSPSHQFFDRRKPKQLHQTLQLMKKLRALQDSAFVLAFGCDDDDYSARQGGNAIVQTSEGPQRISEVDDHEETSPFSLMPEERKVLHSVTRLIYAYLNTLRVNPQSFVKYIHYVVGTIRMLQSQRRRELFDFEAGLPPMEGVNRESRDAIIALAGRRLDLLELDCIAELYENRESALQAVQSEVKDARSEKVARVVGRLTLANAQHSFETKAKSLGGKLAELVMGIYSADDFTKGVLADEVNEVVSGRITEFKVSIREYQQE